MIKAGTLLSGHRRILAAAAILLLIAAALAGFMTWRDIRPLPDSLTLDPADIRKVQIIDRNGYPLSVTYQNNWNYHDYALLYEIPRLLQQAFIITEDQRFYQHGGVDWSARFHALWQNIRALRGVRGASTITEQVVRIIHPRPRTIWSRWVEGFEARRLEKKFGKDKILEFYLNQVPYAAQRRGVVQAARYYFNRDLDTLSTGEMLALAVIVRAPSKLDLKQGNDSTKKRVVWVAKRMRESGIVSDVDFESVMHDDFILNKPATQTQANHFVQYMYSRGISPRYIQNGKLITTLDSPLQATVQSILDHRLKDLQYRHIANGAVLVVDHERGEVLAWVNAGAYSPNVPGSQIDAILTPRQPGSTLKPFLYAYALEKGWTAATLIDDSPLAAQVGAGQHAFNNYSHQNYGLLRLRDCLGNSLNVPAIKAIQFVGYKDFLQRLHLLGFNSLKQDAGFYGEGLALGNGEVTLFELVQAYAALARHGVFQPLISISNDESIPPQKVYSEEVASIITDILSDPKARQLEFGSDNLLSFPLHTAVKTGTSTDYCDAWAIGFSHRYVVGVWMGNLDRRPMQGITGSIGPALALRSIFAELNRREEGKALYLSPRLASAGICQLSGKLADEDCPSLIEWFIPGHIPGDKCDMHKKKTGADLPAAHEIISAVQLEQPTPGLQLAVDPRIPNDAQAFPLQLPRHLPVEKTQWIIDGKIAGTTAHNTHRFLWPLARGNHFAKARVWLSGKSEPLETPQVEFLVK